MDPLLLLTVAQALAACGSMLVVMLGGILGAELAPSPALATLAPALGVVGLAVTTLPAARAMERWGRRRAMAVAATLASLAAGIAALGVARQSFALLCLGCLGIGMHNAFVQQYRFAATDWAPPGGAARALSTVMLGTLAAAFLGREVALAAASAWPGHAYAGSFLALGGLFLLAAGVLCGLPATPPPRPTENALPPRARDALLAQPALRLAIAGSLTAWVAMSFIMTATPVSMHTVDGHDLEATTGVIQAHLLGMYVPALFASQVLRWLGLRRMMLAGCALMIGCVAIAAVSPHSVHHYGWSLVLLGIGWNWLFVASGTLLTATHTSSERFRVQGYNEFITFGAQAIVSLLAAQALFALGWEHLNLLALPLLLGMAVWVLCARPATLNPPPPDAPPPS